MDSVRVGQKRSPRTLTVFVTKLMLDQGEKAEMKRIIEKFVKDGRCVRPIHPDEVIQQIKDSELKTGTPKVAESRSLLDSLNRAGLWVS